MRRVMILVMSLRSSERHLTLFVQQSILSQIHQSLISTNPEIKVNGFSKISIGNKIYLLEWVTLTCDLVMKYFLTCVSVMLVSFLLLYKVLEKRDFLRFVKEKAFPILLIGVWQPQLGVIFMAWENGVDLLSRVSEKSSREAHTDPSPLLSSEFSCTWCSL